MEHNTLSGCRTGQLTVTMIQDVTPGEVWYGKTTTVARLDPLNKPTFMSLKIFRRKFFCPYRILDPDFPDWWTGQSAHTFPTMDIGGAGPGNAAFYQALGLSLNLGRATHNVCAYPAYAYNLIWNKHFRGQDVAEVALNSEIVHRVSHPTNTYYGSLRSQRQLGTVISAGSLAIPDIRDAWTQQRLQEHRELYGDKYIDQLRRFGVKVPYGLIDEPVPVDSARGVMGISEVVETAETGASGGSPGQLAGHGITMFGKSMKPRKFLEPGILMEVAYARPRLSLRDGLDRVWTKVASDESSFYQPEYALKSDVIVDADEVYYQTAAGGNLAYIDNYEWLRNSKDQMFGEMRKVQYDEFSAHKRLAAVPTVAALQYVDDYDDLFQNGTSTNRADVQMYNAHRLTKLSPVRQRGRS